MASSSAAEGVSMDDDYETLIATTDVELLKRAWRNEKAAPEILRYESKLVSRVNKVIQLMEEIVEEKSSGGTDPLSVSLYQMDLDRTLFLLRSYLRIRIQKIEKYVFHIQKTEELRNRLSKYEKDFAKMCENDLEQHLDESVLSKLPKDYKSVLRQSSMSEEDDMGNLSFSEVRRQFRSKLFEMEPGVLHFICYKSIKALVESGKIDLL
ncbi:hypothetical protein JHK87_021755 [Glycine soja]|nr:hypothetical protein JHK87_021755 [Glycine soja]